MAPSQLPPNARVCAYLRDSGGRDQELSVIQQEQAIGGFCKSNALILTRVFKDEARSGTRTLGRDAFDSMIDHLTSEVPELGLVIWSYSRFARDYDDHMFFVSLLRRHDKFVISITDSVPDSLEGRFLESAYAFKDALFSKEHAKNVRRGMHFVVQQHKAFPLPYTPTGYMKERITIGEHRDGSPREVSRLVPDPATAPLIVQAFRMRADGATNMEILRELRVAGDQSTISKILRNRIYIGEFEYGGVLVGEYCTPLIDRDTWRKVQTLNQVRARREGPHHPRAVRSTYILSGLVKCARCGSKLVGAGPMGTPDRRDRYRYYRCSSYNSGHSCGARMIHQDRLEQAVIDSLINDVLRPDVLTILLDTMSDLSQESDTTHSAQIVHIEAAMQETDGKIKRLVSAIADFGHSATMLEELEKLEDQRRDLITQHADLQYQQQQHQAEFIAPDVQELATMLRQLIQDPDRRVVAEALRDIITTITAEIDSSKQIHGTITYNITSDPRLDTSVNI